MSSAGANARAVDLWCAPGMRAELERLHGLADPAAKAPTKRVCAGVREEICGWFKGHQQEVARLPEEVRGETAALVAAGLLKADRAGAISVTDWPLGSGAAWTVERGQHFARMQEVAAWAKAMLALRAPGGERGMESEPPADDGEEQRGAEAQELRARHENGRPPTPTRCVQQLIFTIAKHGLSETTRRGRGMRTNLPMEALISVQSTPGKHGALPHEIGGGGEVGDTSAESGVTGTIASQSSLEGVKESKTCTVPLIVLAERAESVKVINPVSTYVPTSKPHSVTAASAE
eukprot:gene1954-2637_t